MKQTREKGREKIKSFQKGTENFGEYCCYRYHAIDAYVFIDKIEFVLNIFYIGKQLGMIMRKQNTQLNISFLYLVQVKIIISTKCIPPICIKLTGKKLLSQKKLRTALKRCISVTYSRAVKLSEHTHTGTHDIWERVVLKLPFRLLLMVYESRYRSIGTGKWNKYQVKTATSKRIFYNAVFAVLESNCRESSKGLRLYRPLNNGRIRLIDNVLTLGQCNYTVYFLERFSYHKKKLATKTLCGRTHISIALQPTHKRIPQASTDWSRRIDDILPLECGSPKVE